MNLAYGSKAVRLCNFVLSKTRSTLLEGRFDTVHNSFMSYMIFFCQTLSSSSLSFMHEPVLINSFSKVAQFYLETYSLSCFLAKLSSAK